MDLEDITNLGSQGPANDIGAFMHELIEQHHIQHPKQKLKYKELKSSAHIKVTEKEGRINGVAIDRVRKFDGNYIYFRYNPDKTVPRTNDTKYPNTIKIPHKDNNVIKRK